MANVTATTATTREPSSAAVGWTYFASLMMILIGGFHAMVGFIAILDDEFFVTTRNYVLQFDATQWGWIHLIFGSIVAISGCYLLTGNVLARTVGVVMGLVSALIGFAWLPYAPVWGVTIIAIAVAIVWSLTAHGRDVVAYE